MKIRDLFAAATTDVVVVVVRVCLSSFSRPITRQYWSLLFLSLLVLLSVLACLSLASSLFVEQHRNGLSIVCSSNCLSKHGT